MAETLLTLSSQYLKGDEVVKEMSNPDSVIIDVRIKDQFNAGHIDGALNIPLADIDANMDKFKSLNGKKIIFYCNTGKQSGQAAKKLEEKGIQNVFNADGVKDYNYNLVK
ncbi:rhodanese-like domain-containing protein [Campylobacter sputorum]|uniref:rhodanese-like domain-containing protein n=1 Tax=Campylobacter sputorum TaxID=206 RepID=UPI000A64F257|nr:rhodanese-like domain-containing protein [Campylobacter sputorum]